MIVHPNVEYYLNKLSTFPFPELEEMDKLAKERNFPVVGPLVGRFLVSLVQFGHVHTVLECGSGFGYSAMWLATALSENGKITCIEYDSRNIDLAKKFFDKAGFSHKATFIEGDACEIVPTLTNTFDLIVNDIDKVQYPHLLPEMIKRLRIGGMLVSDNILWKGKVTREAEDDATRAIQRFNEMLIEKDCLWNSFIPLRDGISLSIKLRP